MTKPTFTIAGTASISAMDFRKQPGQFLDRVSYRNESFVIERAGEPKAVLVPVRDYQEMKRSKQAAKDRFYAMTQDLRKAFKNVDPKEVEREIEKAIDEVRAAKKSP